MSNPYRNALAELHAAIQLYTGLNPAAADVCFAELVRRLMEAMAASAALLAQPEPEGPSDRDLSQLIERFANPIKSVCKSETEAYIMVSNHFNFARAALALDRARRIP